MSLNKLARLVWRVARSNVSEPAFPYRLTFALTNRCQARCSMCNIWRKPAENELSLQEIEEIVQRANRFSWINLTGGEIFLRPDIRAIVRTIIETSRDLYLLNFPSNGICTGEIVDTVDMILRTTRLPRLIVTISLDGPPDLHNRIRGVPGAFDRAVETFRALRQRRARRFSVFFGYTLQEANILSFDDTVLATREVLGACSIDDFHVNVAHVSGHYYSNAGFKGIPDSAVASDLLARISRTRTVRLLDPVAVLERRYQAVARSYLVSRRVPLTCQAAAASCFIDPAGTVYACTGLASPVGSLRKNGYALYDLWHSPDRLRVRQAVRSGACPGCWTPCEAYQTLMAHALPVPGRRA
jgi:MoaA/NifB/PqqE/SkfB family radical SAM enzyme